MRLAPPSRAAVGAGLFWVSLASAGPDPAQPDEAEADVVITGRGPKVRLERSAEAVEVVDLAEAQVRGGDLGATLNRAKGVNLRRSGGLGTPAELNLGGLSGDQVRVFFDGLPIEVSGLSFGLANIPPSLLARVEIYKGVVPIRFGADALGGALNLVPDARAYETASYAAYQVGSFGTHRAIARHSQRLDVGGFVAVSAFVDRATNDYPVDVDVARLDGRLVPTTVDRFHDEFTGWGVVVEGGLRGHRWADELSLRVFLGGVQKAVQHNVLVTVPYGEVEVTRGELGATARYAGRGAGCGACEATLVLSFARRTTELTDVSPWVYDWLGERIRERRFPGEIFGRPVDQALLDHTVFSRAGWAWPIEEHHRVEVSVSPTYSDRSGRDRTVNEGRDRLAAERSVLRVVSGVEYTTTPGEQLELRAFGKHYGYRTGNEERLPDAGTLDRSTESQRFGGGAGLRWAPWPEVQGKLSYEYATRLPSVDEIYGDGALIVAALDLEPETSHNANLSLTAGVERSRAGELRGGATGFLRETDRLITLVGSPQALAYTNVYGARSLGVEGALGWTSPGRWLRVDLNATWQDVRNTASRGALARFAGDRIPNQPYLFGNGAARLSVPSVFHGADGLTLGWDTRYVHAFFRTWESLGRPDLKDTVDDQWVHSAYLSYSIDAGGGAFTATIDVENLTDARAFDYYRVQRPGRAGYLRVSADL